MVVLLLILAHSIQAQDAVCQFSRFRVLLQTGERFEGREGQLNDTKLKDMLTTGVPINVPVGKIRALDVYSGVFSEENTRKFAVEVGIPIPSASRRKVLPRR